MKFVGGGLTKASLRFFSTVVLRRKHRGKDWLPVLIVLNMLVCFGLVTIYLLRRRMFG